MAEARQRVVVVTTAWSRAGEAAYLVRRVAAALAMTAEVTVVVAEGHRGPVVECAEGAFRVLRVPSQVPDLHRANLLQGALTAGIHGSGAGPEAGSGGSAAATPRAARATTPRAVPAALRATTPRAVPAALRAATPAAVRAELCRLAGSADDGLGQLLGSLHPDAVVVADHRAALALEGFRGGGDARRKALLALAVDDLALQLSLTDGGGHGWDAILATNAYEADLLRRSLGHSSEDELVHDLGVCLERPPNAGAETQLGVSSWVGEEIWLLVLDDPSAAPRFPAVDYLSLRLPTLTMVVVSTTATTVALGRRRRVGTPLNRTALWDLMQGAVATLDLRPAQVLAREVIESLLLATPVVVPANSGAARRCAEDADGGLWYQDPPELAACVARMRDRNTREALGAQGCRWATRTHGDQNAFVEAATRAVLG